VLNSPTRVASGCRDPTGIYIAKQSPPGRRPNRKRTATVAPTPHCLCQAVAHNPAFTANHGHPCVRSFRRKSWAEGRGQREEGSGKWEEGSGKWEVGSGKWEVGSGKWEVGSGKWEVGSGKWEWPVGKNEDGDRMMDYEKENTVFADNGADCAVRVPAAGAAGRLPPRNCFPGSRRLRKGRREADVPQTPLFTVFTRRSPGARVVREKRTKTTSREKLFRKPLFLRQIPGNSFLEPLGGGKKGKIRPIRTKPQSAAATGRQNAANQRRRSGNCATSEAMPCIIVAGHRQFPQVALPGRRLRPILIRLELPNPR